MSRVDLWPARTRDQIYKAYDTGGRGHTDWKRHLSRPLANQAPASLLIREGGCLNSKHHIVGSWGAILVNATECLWNLNPPNSANKIGSKRSIHMWAAVHTYGRVVISSSHGHNSKTLVEQTKDSNGRFPSQIGLFKSVESLVPYIVKRLFSASTVYEFFYIKQRWLYSVTSISN